MKEETTYIDVGNSKILNLDVDEFNSFIAFTDENEVIADNLKFTIDKKFQNPFIRKLNDEIFLIADSRLLNDFNGYIYDFTGQLISTFLAGDGIEDIVIQRDKIVVTYFDEGVLGKNGPNNNGVAVFNFQGQVEFGFNESIGSAEIIDCYCICKHGVNRVLFYAYTEFKVYELNLDNYQWQAFEAPNTFLGASAMTSKENNIIFHSSYDDKTSFFSWNRNTNEVTILANYSLELKGIKNGKFLAFDDKGFTIVNPTK